MAIGLLAEAKPAADTAALAVVEEWITAADDIVDLQMAMGTAEGRCDGKITLDAKQKRLRWTTLEGGPCAGFEVPVNTVRPVTAATEGGVSLTFVNEGAVSARC